MKGTIFVLLAVAASSIGCLRRRNDNNFPRLEEIDSQEDGVKTGEKGTSCPCGWANKVTQRIVGGRETGVNEYPWIAGLSRRVRLIDFFCSGSIISEYHVLTAAHCVFKYRPSELLVVVGEHNLLTEKETQATQKIEVISITKHEKYSKLHATNDIAVITLKRAISFSKQVGPICMPKVKYEYNLVDKYVKIMGWGDIKTGGPSSNYLRHTNIKIVPLESCKNWFEDSKISTLFPKQLCTFTQKRDTCQGDSGGPLAYLDPEANRYMLVGIVSYGGKCADISPGVNTDITAYLDWIQENMRKTKPNGKVCSKL